MLPFGIQLYSVRDHLAIDALGTLKALKTAGYDHVELFGVGPEHAAEWKTMLDDSGLDAVAAHVDFDIVVEDAAGCAEMARVLGFKDIIIPWVKVDTATDWVHAARAMDEAGAAIRREGLRLGYHNHDHEFESIDVTTPFDVIFEYAKPENLFLELDVRWASEHGGDAVTIIQEFGERCRFLHIKERPKPGHGQFTEVGNGTIDWAPIFDAARHAGVQWYIVEQDESAADSLESAAISAAFMARQ